MCIRDRINKSLEKNDKHVDNLRELNNDLMSEIKSKVQDQMEIQAKATDDIKDNNTKEIENIKLDIDLRFKDFEELKTGDVQDLKVRIQSNNQFEYRG